MQKFIEWFKITEGRGPDWKKLIDSIDMNKDGQIEWDEFMTAATNRYRLVMNEESLRTAFNVLDIDGNGTISLEELKLCFSYSDLDNEEINEENLWQKMLADIDTDQDGNISFDEFKNHMLILIEKGGFDKRPTIQESGVQNQVNTQQVAVSVPEANSDINNSESEDEFQDAHSELTPEMLQESNQPFPQQVANSDIVSNDTE